MPRAKSKKIPLKKPARLPKPPLPELEVQEKTKTGAFLLLMLVVIGITFFSYLVYSAISLNTGSVKMAASVATPDFYVNCDAVANGSGTLASPFNSIAGALASDLVVSGKRLEVQASDCTKEGRIVITKSGIILQAKSPVATKGFTVFNIGAMQPVNGVTIDGFNITTDAGTDPINGPGIILYGNDHTISNNIISNTYRQGIYLNGEYSYEVKRNKIINNKISRAGLAITDFGELFFASGIVVSGAQAGNNLIDGNEVFENQHAGIAIVGQANNNTVSNNRNISNNGGYGIVLSSGAGNNIVEKNVVYGNGRKMDDVFGIDVFKAGNNNIVRYNEVYGQYDTLNDGSIGVNPGNANNGGTSKFGTGGIRFDGEVPSATAWEATGNQAYYNLVYNERVGLAVLNFNNVSLYNNTVYNITDSGLSFLAYNDAKTNFGGLVVKNNIIHTAGKAVSYLVRPNSTWSSYPVFNNNIYYQNGGAKFVWLVDGSSANEVDFSGWKKLTAIAVNGSDAGSLISDPLLTSPASGNFVLGAGSPAVNSGLPVGLNYDLSGQLLVGNPDVGAYESATAAVCVENWSCGEWSDCVNGTQTRSCTDANICGTTISKPEVSQACTAACLPNCTGKVCGDNGCGGSCGTCATGQTCTNGACLSAKITCTTDSCCKTNYYPYVRYNRYKRKCCRSSSLFTSNSNCVN